MAANISYFDTFDIFDTFDDSLTTIMDNLRKDKKFAISASKLTEILDTIAKKTFKPSYKCWDNFFHLHSLEICFSNSEEYSIDKAVLIFLNHFEQLKKIHPKIFGLPYTPASEACKNRSPVLLAAYLKAGVDVNESVMSMGFNFIPLLHETVESMDRKNGPGYSKEKTLQCLDLLISNKADITAEENYGMVKVRDQKGHTALWHAVAFSDEIEKEDIVKVLVKAKSDVNVMSNNLTPLMIAAKFLPADYEKPKKTSPEHNIIHVIRVLLDSNADCFAVNSRKQTALDLIPRGKISEAEFTERSKLITSFMVNYIAKATNICVKPLIEIIIQYLRDPKGSETTDEEEQKNLAEQNKKLDILYPDDKNRQSYNEFHSYKN